MPVILIQPQNAEGKTTPMCAFDPKNGYIGHSFVNMTQGQTHVIGTGQHLPADPLIVCARCGVLWIPHDESN